jgi:hypothetical protein
MKPYDHDFDPSSNMDTRKAWRYNADAQFDYDETLLEQGRYKEWFYEGLQESQLSYLRQPPRVDKVEQEPVGYDGWEARQSRKWQNDAACIVADPVIFFTEEHYPKREYLKPDAEWRQYCPSCPVREACLQAARDSESVGTWGGKLFHYDKTTSKIQEHDDTTIKGTGGRGRPRKA